MEFYDRHEERTGVQESRMYNSKIDVQCDFVMVYGIDDSFEERVAEFRKRGYIIHLMTGVAWGKYVDYLEGRFDGREHWDEGQLRRNGSGFSHGKNTPYMVPTIAFSNYLVSILKRAVDAGVEAIHMEEPEFWVDSGYSDAFKREWEMYYHEPWQDPVSSADAQFRASKLKSHMYARTLDRLSAELKEYAKIKYGRSLRFYVPTHSLINYTHWRIVSPEGALIDIPGVDGYIAQIWTGTSRTRNVYEGIFKERTFETAFLEYGVMQELVRGTGKRMWFLHDPIEDNPRHDWEDYRSNYFKTVAASLFHPNVHHFEVCPWPNRVMHGKYPRGDNGISIPADYATNMLTIMHTLRDMKQTEYGFDGGMKTVGVLMADSGMFQRQIIDTQFKKNESENKETLVDGHPIAAVSNDDKTNDIACFNSFYGLTLPLLKQGLSVRPVQLDNVRRFPNYLKDYDTLILSYEFFKPEYPDIHNALAGWVKEGGTLIYVGDGSDIFHDIRHWWTENGYNNASEHLSECLGLGKNFTENGKSAKKSITKAGKGWVCKMTVDPKNIALKKPKAAEYRNFVEQALNARGVSWDKRAEIILRRGKYVITAVMDESEYSKPHTLKGTYFNLFTPLIEIEKDPVLQPGSVGLYIDAGKIDKGSAAQILAVSSRVANFKETEKRIKFTAIGPEDVMASMRIYLPKKPEKVKAVLNGKEIKIDCKYNSKTSTALFRYWNSPDGVDVTINKS
ncbi:MAG: hypothetical protein FWG69_01250 [Oscillospiraceae bacterium]|nr:hypothetical protein [Oscillospiraceae bacterium]